MSSGYIDLPVNGGATWKDPVASAANLPATGNSPGDVRVVLDTDSIYIWNGTAWILEVAPGATPPGGSNTQVQYNNAGAFAGSPGLTYNSGTQALTVIGAIAASNFSGSSSGANTGDVTLTAVGSSANANGASLSGQVLTLQPATTAFPGVLTAADWNTFNGKQGAVSIGALDAQAANANGLALVANVLSTQSADATHPGMVNNTTQSFSGNKTFTGTIVASNFSGSSSGTNTGDVTLTAVGSSSNTNGASLSGQVLTLQPATTSFPGVLTAADWNTFNSKQTAVSIGVLDAQAANANGLALVAGVLSTQSADATHPGMVNNTAQSFSGAKTFTGTIAASNFSGSSSGTNTGDITLTAVGSSANANGASLSGQALTLQPATTAFPGVLTAADWNTFNNKQATVTIGALDAQAANATGLALVSNVLSTQSASATSPGLVNNTAQTLSGAKTFSSNITLTPMTLGSVIFASTAGLLAQDNANFFWDATNHRLGIGNAAPLTMLHLSETSTAIPRGILADQYSTGTSGSRITMRKARGTFASPSVIVTGDALASWTASGYDGSTFIESGKILSTSTGTISTGTVPSTMALQTMNTSGVLTSGITISEAQVVNLPQLTASLPVQTDSSKNLVSAAITLSGSQVTGTLGIANGGTGGTTAATARSSLAIDKRTTFSNADYTILSTDKYVAQVGTLSAARTATLPAASAVNPGFELIIADETGTVTTTNTIIVARAGSDTIDSLTSTTISAPFGIRKLVSDGTSKWTITSDQITNSQVFTGNGTWTKPAGARWVRVMAIGGGGGGGSGTRQAAGTARTGGGGGGGGGYSDKQMLASLCGTTETIVVAATAAGGIAVTSDGTIGNAGTNGNSSSFGTAATAQFVFANGGDSGNAGQLAANAATSRGGAGTSIGGSGASSSGTGGNGTVGSGLNFGFTGGGGSGGGITAADQQRAGGAGGAGISGNLAGGTAGTSGGGTGGAGTSSVANDPCMGGGGGGGGGTSITTTSGTGGAGGNFGGGGGGGGASVNGQASGAGGVGAGGIVVVYTW